MENELYEELKASFEKTYEAMRRDLSRVRSGRANPNLLDTIRVSYYGQLTPLSQLAAIQVPEARMITIKPWEAPLLKEIERAILSSDLGITPSTDGTVIRLAVPPLTEERRKELVKKVNNISESAKIAVRNQRRDTNKLFQDMEKAGELSEDDLARALKQVQALTDAAIEGVDKIIAAKEEELMEV